MHDTATNIARAILGAFDRHSRDFRAASVEARACFERGDWAGIRAAGRRRIDGYDAQVRDAVAVLRARFPSAGSESVWPATKRAYVGLLLEHQQPELAETFFNSVACRVLARTYYSNAYIFWRPAISTEHLDALQPTYRVYYPPELGLRATLGKVLSDLQLLSPWEDRARDLAWVERDLVRLLPRPRAARPNLQVQVLSSLFFRHTAAYLFGVLINGAEEQPFACALLKNGRGELYIDALLTEREEIATLFSLARASFLVDMEAPSAFVQFLRRVVPRRSPAELYMALGLAKHAKTLVYRELFHHLKHSSDRFVVAPGVRGMVMTVFSLPSFPWVFKLLRDRFAPPKDTDAEAVRQKYLFVKHHDRVGRMADTLEYRDVALPKSRFDPALLEELRRLAPSLLEESDETVVIKHLYIERRMVPLDLFLRERSGAQREAALLDYGDALRELAGAGLFPGDLLTKNFGVTRAGRVVFYDYDELCTLDECVFKALPTPPDDNDTRGADSYASVGPYDVFPEEWARFLFADAADLETFSSRHADLLTPAFWRAKQAQLAAGIEEDVFPYPQARRAVHRRAIHEARRTS